MSEYLLTIKEVAEQIGCNQNYVHKLRKSGLLPALKLGTYKVTRKSLEAFLINYEGWDLTDPYNPKDERKHNDREESI